MKAKILAVALLALTAAAPLCAEAVFTYYGSNEFGATYNRPLNTTTLSGSVVPYSVVGFYPNETAICSIYNTQEGNSFDGHIALYEHEFDPADPLANLVAVNDDFNWDVGGLGFGHSAIERVELSFVYNYYLVTSGYYSADTGTYSATISCADPATRVLPDSPELPVYDGTIHTLRNGRFAVWAGWRDFADNTGAATFVPMGSSETGLMWFFAPTNFEVMIKILDGCGLNSRYWVFFAATTSVEFTINVYDIQADVLKQYTNALGVSAQAVTDTSAFATCP